MVQHQTAMKQQVVLNEQSVTQIMRETGQQFADCQKKDYYVHARLLPHGLVFANKLEQPESYKEIMQTFHKPIVPMQAITPQLSEKLKVGGCYVTDNATITMCGTIGELWLKPIQEFLSENVIDQIIPKNMLQSYLATEWRRVAHKGEQRPAAKGIFIPNKYIGAFKTSRDTLLYANHPDSEGHGVGDIIVMPCINDRVILAQGVIVNNAVFTNTFNLNVGGWASRGIAQQSRDTLPLTTDKVKKLFVI